MPENPANLYKLWDFLSPRGENTILRWVRDERLTIRDRAALNQKLDRLLQMDFRLAIETKMLAGPIYGHIYKLVIHADHMLRPMLCRGPIENDKEYTLLLGAIEIGRKLPIGCEKEAEENRKLVLGDKRWRRDHERIPNRP